MTSARRFVAGVLIPFRGAMLIATRADVARAAVLPFLATFFVFVIGLLVGLPLITNIVSPFTHRLLTAFGIRLESATGEIFSFILPILIWPALVLALMHVLLTFTRLIASPLYLRLARRVLGGAAFSDGAASSGEGWLTRQKRLFNTATRKTVLFLLIGLVLGLLSILPFLGIFTSFLFLILLAYDVVDYALEAKAWRRNQRVEFFRQHFAVFLGLGLILGLVFLVPGLNFFVVPASVTGASDLVRRMNRE